MHKIIPIIIFFSLSACGGGGSSDEVSKNVGEAGIDIDNVYGDFADNVAADAAEEAATAALQVSQEQATALAIAISDAEEAANSNLFESATLGSSKFQ